MSANEIWVPGAGYKGSYEVSNLGRVRSLDRVVTDGSRRAGRILAPATDGRGDGYKRVGLHLNGKCRMAQVHRLVAAAFLDRDPERHHVNHKDGNPSNNQADNLEWVTSSENLLHASRVLMRGTRPVYGVHTITGATVTFPSAHMAAEFGFDQSSISSCARGVRRTHRGYRWSFDSPAARLNGDDHDANV